MELTPQSIWKRMLIGKTTYIAKKKTMRTLLFLSLMIIYSGAFCQKTYNVIGVIMDIQGLKFISESPKIIKLKYTVIVSDSAFTTITKQRTDTFKIVKKINDNYFKITDGLKEYIIKITEQKFGKYAGVISQEMDKGYIFMYYQ